MDEADHAGIAETMERERALANQRAAARERERPREVAGRRYCLGCGEPLQAQRIAARPESVRCVDCQEQSEQQNRRFR